MMSIALNALISLFIISSICPVRASSSGRGGAVNCGIDLAAEEKSQPGVEAIGVGAAQIIISGVA